MVTIDRRTHETIRKTLSSISGLSVYSGIRKDPLLIQVKELLLDILSHSCAGSETITDNLSSFFSSDTAPFEESDIKYLLSWIESYTGIYHALITNGVSSSPDFGAHILQLAKLDDNAFVRYTCGLKAQEMDRDMRSCVLLDFERIRVIASLPARTLTTIFAPVAGNDLPEWRHLSSDSDATRLMDDFITYHHQNSFGVFSQYHAFILKKGSLEPVESPDPIRLDQLFQYEYEINQVKDNTFRLLDRRRPDNILLFGARGTGKSSTVKAIANTYKDRGLRLIEIDKDELLTIADLLTYLSGLTSVRLSFILFLDDLTFPEDDHRYTILKTLLEGGMKTRPENVAIYATSNRRHIVAEKESNDMYMNDAKEERLSLSDRFGISVRFSSPNQQVFLDIVYGILTERGIIFDREITAQKALTWTMRENGRSPRTARQFADFYESSLREEHKEN
jgi:predicted AAA+ superfamily ATPase